MNAKAQGTDEILVKAEPKAIWDLLEDSQRLAEWMPIVESSTGTIEKVGAVRECEVNFEGRAGTVVEKCIESIPHKRIAWHLEKDTLGFDKMLADFGFSFELEPRTDGMTLVKNVSYYEPKNMLARVMNA